MSYDIIFDEDDEVSVREGATFGAFMGSLIGLGASLNPSPDFPFHGALGAALCAFVGFFSGVITGGIVAALVDFREPADMYTSDVHIDEELDEA